MDELKPPANFRLFTYKVTFDAGTAPNVDGNICTLAICKPVIRRVAQTGDIVIGFSPYPSKIIYCMLVEHSVTWEEYVKKCKDPASGLTEKIPKSQLDVGDCIWGDNPKNKHEPKISRSGHTIDNFESDVERGKNVLISGKYWYFGTDGEHNLTIPTELQEIIPNRGHQSIKNEKYKENFVTFFNNKLKELHICNYGSLGYPKYPKGNCKAGGC